MVQIKRRIFVEGGGRIWVDCPQALVLVLDSLVGTFLGETRAEIARFMLQDWITEHIGTLRGIHAAPRPPEA